MVVDRGQDSDPGFEPGVFLPEETSPEQHWIPPYNTADLFQLSSLFIAQDMPGLDQDADWTEGGLIQEAPAGSH